MRKLLLFLTVFLGSGISLYAQWSGSYPAPMGTRQVVGIGTLSPTADLHILQDLTGSMMVPPLKPLVKIQIIKSSGITEQRIFLLYNEQRFCRYRRTQPADAAACKWQRLFP